jgi:hypothetical protein
MGFTGCAVNYYHPSTDKCNPLRLELLSCLKI